MGILMDDFFTEETFMKYINVIVENKGLDHMEAVIEFCSENNLDVEDVIPLIGRSLKEKIRVDAENAGMMKDRTARLPL